MELRRAGDERGQCLGDLGQSDHLERSKWTCAALTIEPHRRRICGRPGELPFETADLGDKRRTDLFASIEVKH